MIDRIAIKRLTASDCTLFEAVFRKIKAGNQKSINLNGDVLTGRFYPNLAASAAASDNEIPLAISIYGPAGKGAHKLSRKIIKNPSYKNWRLNGEFIHGPPDDPTRYDGVQPNDVAIMVFKGEPAPNRMDLILISQDDTADAGLHKALTALFGNRSMVELTASELAAAAQGTVSESHPVTIVAADPEVEAALEDAAQGGFEGTKKLLKSKAARKISASDLAKAKAKGERTGQDGEGLVNGHLAAELAAGRIASYKWTSAENAIAPFDFEVTDAAGEQTLIDAKATDGKFENAIHLSLAEIIEAADASSYVIYRVYEISEDGAKLKKSHNIRPLALELKGLHDSHIPNGIRVDSFSVNTSVLSWESEISIVRQDDDAH